MNLNLQEQLSQLKEIKLYSNIDLKKYSTMKLCSQGSLLEIHSLKALQEVVVLLNKKGVSYQVIGWGANTLLPENLGEKILLKLKFQNYKINDFFKLSKNYTFPACFPLPSLVKMAEKFCLSGWECLTGIPASIGGATFMNAGTKLGEIGSLITSVRYVSKSGELKEHCIDKSSFSYRQNNFLEASDVIYEVSLTHEGVDETVPSKISSYRKLRRETQPLDESSCGCVFKNFTHESAGKVIDEIGLKGFRYKNLSISEVHANFIINHGGATLEDFSYLVAKVKAKVLEEKGQKIECEVRYPL